MLESRNANATEGVCGEDTKQQLVGKPADAVEGSKEGGEEVVFKG